MYMYMYMYMYTRCEEEWQEVRGVPVEGPQYLIIQRRPLVTEHPKKTFDLLRNELQEMIDGVDTSLPNVDSLGKGSTPPVSH